MSSEEQPESQTPSGAATSFAELTHAAQVIALQAQNDELRRENNALRIELDQSAALRADAADAERKYEALRNSTLGKVTVRYWQFRRNLKKRP